MLARIQTVPACWFLIFLRCDKTASKLNLTIPSARTMSFYQINLAVFAAGNAYLLYRQYRREHKTRETQSLASDSDREDADAVRDDLLAENGAGAGSQEAVRRFKRDFFAVYALAVAADWLQVSSRDQSSFVTPRRGGA